MVVSETSGRGRAPWCGATMSTRPRRSSGSPPVNRTSRMPSCSTPIRTSRTTSSSVSISSVGQPVEALGRHAVAAAQVAPVGQRDAQVGRHPSVAVRRVAVSSPPQSRGLTRGRRRTAPPARTSLDSCGRGIPAEPALGAVRRRRSCCSARRLVARPVAVPPARRPQARATRSSRANQDRRPGPGRRRARPGRARRRGRRVAPRHRARHLGRPTHTGSCRVPDPRRRRPASTSSPRWSPTTAPPLLVDRGWMATENSGASPPDLPAVRRPARSPSRAGYAATRPATATTVSDLSTRAISASAIGEAHRRTRSTAASSTSPEDGPARRPTLEPAELPDDSATGRTSSTGCSGGSSGCWRVFGFCYLAWDEWRRSARRASAREAPPSEASGRQERPQAGVRRRTRGVRRERAARRSQARACRRPRAASRR